MNFIKQLIEGKTSEESHNQLIRYGLGKYENRGVVKFSNGPTMKLQTSFEYANYFVKLVAENLEGPFEVKGKLISKIKLENSVKKKNSYVVEYSDEISSEELQKLVEERYNDSHFLFNVSPYLKIKASLPRPGGKVKDNFCTLSFKGNDELRKKIIEDFAFDIDKEFKKAIITHTFLIENIEVPEEHKDDPVAARANAKRVGTIKRNLEVDGEQTNSSHSLSS